MPQFIMIFLYIILFLFCLGVLIVVHELGHLSMAKAFNVYCLEFSVGMGPKLFRRKRKKGETYFALRAIPFGGYVSMYGEGVELPEGLEISDDRNFNKIKKWKRLIILIAGVTMNAILALLIFIFTCTCMPQNRIYMNPCSVKEDSIAYNAGIRTGDTVITLDNYEINEFYVLCDNGLANYSDRNEPIAATLYRAVNSRDALSYNYYMNFYHTTTDDQGNLVIDLKNAILPDSANLNYVEFSLATKQTSESEIIKHDIKLKPINDGKQIIFEELGVSLNYEEFKYGFGQGMTEAFKLFGESSIAIFKGLGSLFTNFENVGGIIAVGVQTTNTLNNFGWTSFLNMWGLISVNLAIINLLPFPGLDGWQILVLIVEMVAHKEIPSKVKNIVSFVGIALLFLLMIAIVIKDIIWLI